MNYAVIFAGGVGSRVGSNIPKQFLKIDNKPIIIHTIEKFDIDIIDKIIIVCIKNYIDLCREYIKNFNIKNEYYVVEGGINSQASIFNGLNFIITNFNTNSDDIVLIHDGVRPNINRDLIELNIDKCRKKGSAISASKATETVVEVSSDKINKTIDRQNLMYARAPQTFKLNQIFTAHKNAIKEKKLDFIDSASLMEYFGYELYYVETSYENIKITNMIDLYLYETMFNKAKEKL